MPKHAIMVISSTSPQLMPSILCANFGLDRLRSVWTLVNA
jgi:hypothetical protein